MRATLQAVQRYELHGVPWYQLQYLVDGEQQPRSARVAHEVAYRDPLPGDRIEVAEILGIVDRVTHVE